MIRAKMEVYKEYIRIFGKDKNGKESMEILLKYKNYRKGERKTTFIAEFIVRLYFIMYKFFESVDLSTLVSVCFITKFFVKLVF
jgi:hypothetical protein